MKCGCWSLLAAFPVFYFSFITASRASECKSALRNKKRRFQPPPSKAFFRRPRRRLGTLTATCVELFKRRTETLTPVAALTHGAGVKPLELSRKKVMEGNGCPVVDFFTS